MMRLLQPPVFSLAHRSAGVGPGLQLKLKRAGFGLRACGAALGIIGMASETSGELAWERTSVEVTAKSTEPAAIAEYRFKNSGVDPITIRQVQPDCGCVTTPLEKTTFAPGEEGRLLARFELGDQPMDRQIPIHVSAESAGRKFNSVLVLRAKIQEVVRFSQRQLYWRANERLEPKVITLTVSPEDKLTIKDARSETPSFKVELRPTDDPHTYHLEVTPPAERTRAVATIAVSTHAEDRSDPIVHRMIARVL